MKSWRPAVERGRVRPTPIRSRLLQESLCWFAGCLPPFICWLTVLRSLRVFGGYDKGADYYLHEPLFHVKMGLLVLILILEVPSMLELMRWRASIRRGAVPNLKKARFYARYSVIQTVLLVLMVFAATGMARGIGLPAGAV